MRFYLSSYKIGNQQEKLIQMVGGSTIGFIPNAIDHLMDSTEYQESNKKDIEDLQNLGINIEYLDLRQFFGDSSKLQEKINSLGGIWIRGGNVFILRQAMALSGLDTILLNKINTDFLYSGYSAGPCIAGPTLKWLDIVDDPTLQPYETNNTIWDGLGLIDYCFAPHYRSDHHESELIEQEVQRMIDNKVLFKALKDGEVIIIE